MRVRQHKNNRSTPLSQISTRIGEGKSAGKRRPQRRRDSPIRALAAALLVDARLLSTGIALASTQAREPHSQVHESCAMDEILFKSFIK